jgi:hypothetical protein
MIPISITHAYDMYTPSPQPNSAVLYANRSVALLKANRIDEAIADGLKATQVNLSSRHASTIEFFLTSVFTARREMGERLVPICRSFRSEKAKGQEFDS